MRRLVVVVSAAAALLLVPAAGGKNFHPGDLRVCGAKRCVVIRDRSLLDRIGSFYYGTAPLTDAHRPARGTPYYQLRFRNGYVSGIVATKRLDRFLSGGVNLGRFASNQWYRVPARVSAGLRRAASGLQPRHLASPAPSRLRSWRSQSRRTRS